MALSLFKEHEILKKRKQKVKKLKLELHAD